jgi:hypothetical protein
MSATRRHVLLGTLVPVAYVVLVAMRHTARVGTAVLVVSALAMGIAWTAARAPTALLRWALWGASLTVASLIEPSFATRVSTVVGALVASLAGAAGLTRIASLGGRGDRLGALRHHRGT